MSFQGFAREQGFSDNQIRIDINSVIENDLAEANRQTRALGRNATLEGQWGNMYLNSLMKKHEVEKRNREENFAFFMDNRKEIQKIVQYNNEVKYKDAGKNRHVEGLDSILGKGLLQLAVNVGSAAIGKLAQDVRAEWDEADATQEKETIDWGKRFSVESSPAQREALKNPEIVKQIRSNVAAESAAAIEHYNSLGEHKLGVNASQNIYRWNNLDKIDRQNTLHGTKITAIAAQEHIENFSVPINGSEPITLNDVLSGIHSKATADVWLEQWKSEFYEVRGINDVGSGAYMKASEGVRSIQAQVQKAISNSQYKKDLKDQEIQRVSEWENTSGSTRDKFNFVMKPLSEGGAGIVARSGDRAQGLEWIRDHLEKYGSAEEIREVMGFSFPGIPTINEGGPSEEHPSGTVKYQKWRAALNAAVAREEQGHVNTQAERDGKLKMIADQITSKKDKQIARTTLLLTEPGGELNEQFSSASPTARKAFLNSLRAAAGYGGEAPTITAGQKVVNDQITNTEATNNGITFIKEMGTGKEIALDGIPTAAMNSLKGSIADTYRAWASDLADQLMASGVRPEDVEAEINAIVRTDDPRTDPLKKALQARWTDPNATDPNKRLLVPQFPYMRKPISKDAKGFTQSYDEAYWAAQKAGQTFGLADIDLEHPVVESWLGRVDKANRYKHIDLQNELSNAPAWVKHIMRTQKFSTPGQVYQAALDNVKDYGDKYKKLSESDYMDYTEVKQQYDTLGGQFAALNQHVKEAIAAQGGYIPNANAARTIQPSTWNIPNGYSFGKYGSKIPYSGDTDGQETGTDFRLPAGQGAPIRFPFPVTVMRTGTTGHPAYGLQGTSGRLGASGRGFGYHMAVKVKLPNGNDVELVIGHLDGMSPLANIPPGTVLPPGTTVGNMGASGRSLTHGGGPYDHLTIHTNGLNGYRSTPKDLMNIVHNLYHASAGGNQ